MERAKTKYYVSVNLLHIFSNIYEQYAHKNLSSMSLLYRKKYGANHVLLRFIENWKLSLDNNKFVGAVIIDLSIKSL